MTDGPLLWYLNRSTGLVILVLLTCTTVLGLLSTGGRPGGWLPRFVTQSVHRNLALLSVMMLAAHITTAVADTYVDIRWWQALLPVGASYQPLWLGLGAVAFDLIVVVVATSLLRHHLSQRIWRGVHALSWVAWVLGVAHGIGIGTDVRSGAAWAVTPTVVCVGVVAVAAGVRLARLARGLPEAVHRHHPSGHLPGGRS